MKPSHLSFELFKKKKLIKLKKKKTTEIIIENIALGKENKEIKIKHMNESSSSTIKEININSKYFKKRKRTF